MSYVKRKGTGGEIHWQAITDRKKNTGWKATKEVRIPPKLFDEMDEFQTGSSFGQTDTPLIHDARKDRRCSRGGYRFHDVARNVFDYAGPDIGEYVVSSDDPNYKKPDDPNESNHHAHHRRKTELRRGSCTYPDENEIPFAPEPKETVTHKVQKVARHDYDYDDPQVWMRRVHKLPEYQQRSKSRDFLKVGTFRSAYDYDSSEETPSSVHPMKYHIHPEFQVRTKSKDYKKEGTLRSSHDYRPSGVQPSGGHLSGGHLSSGHPRKSSVADPRSPPPPLPRKATFRPAPPLPKKPLSINKTPQRKSSVATDELSLRMRTEMQRFRDMENDPELTSQYDRHPNDYGTSHYSEYEQTSLKNGREVYESSQESFSHLHHAR